MNRGFLEQNGFGHIGLRIATAFCAMLVLVSCGKGRRTMRQLKDIKSYHIEYSDSARAALDKIDLSSLNSKSAAAKYSLLSGAVRLFQGGSIEEYASIQPAVSYYSKGKGSLDERIGCRILLSNFHYGRKEYDVALLDIVQAELLAGKCRNQLVKGLVQLFKSDILWDLHEDVELLQCCWNAYGIFSKTSSDALTGLSLMYLGQTYNRMDMADSAIVYYDRIIDNPSKFGKDWYYPEAMFHKAEAMMILPETDYAAVRKLIERALGLKQFEEDATVKALYAYVVSKDTGEHVTALVNDALREMSRYEDTEDANYWLNRLYMEQGDLAKAYAYLDKSFDERIETDAFVYTHSVYRALQENQQHQNRQTRHAAIMIVVLLSIVIILLAAFAFVLIRSHRSRMAILQLNLDKDKALQELQRTELQKRVGDFSNLILYLQKNVSEKEKDDSEEGKVAKSVFSSILKNAIEGIGLEEIIGEQVRSRFPLLETALDSCGQPLTKLNKQVLYLSIIGYDPAVIAFVCGMTVLTYNTHKSQIRSKLRACGNAVLDEVAAAI